MKGLTTPDSLLARLAELINELSFIKESGQVLSVCVCVSGL